MLSPQVSLKQQEKSLVDTVYQSRETTQIRAVLNLILIWQSDAMRSFSMARNHDELLKAQAEYNYLVKLAKIITHASPVQAPGVQGGHGF